MHLATDSKWSSFIAFASGVVAGGDKEEQNPSFYQGAVRNSHLPSMDAGHAGCWSTCLRPPVSNMMPTPLVKTESVWSSDQDVMPK